MDLVQQTAKDFIMSTPPPSDARMSESTPGPPQHTSQADPAQLVKTEARTIERRDEAQGVVWSPDDLRNETVDHRLPERMAGRLAGDTVPELDERDVLRDGQGSGSLFQMAL